ncbi:MAG: ABC transporter permease [Burkholderiales bacterium]|nr:ABC transporter permease [Burkholderiales bacterium]
MKFQLLLALRNVFRQKARSAATLIAIAVGVAGLILAGGFVQDIFIQLGEAIIHAHTGHLQVTRQGYREGKTRAPEAYLIDAPDRLKVGAGGTAGVDKVFARLNFTGVINNGKRDLGIIGEGIEPAAEGEMSTYLHYMEGRPLGAQDDYGIVVGQGVAKSLGLKVGDRVNLVISIAQGAVNTLDFELVGVFQSFSKEFDARAVRIPLPAARELMDTQGAHVLVVMLRQTEDTERVATELEAGYGPQGYEVARWNKLSDFYEKAVDLYDRQFGVLRLIILLMVLLSVANSVNMAIFERTREFGTVIALGTRPTAVFRAVLTESVIVGLIGALLGMTVGSLLALGISAIGIPMPPPPNANLGYTAEIRLLPWQVLSAGLIGFVATCLAAIRPARRVSKLDVVEALRHGT